MPSSGESEGGGRPDRKAMVRLEEAVARVLSELRAQRERARRAEERLRSVEEALGPNDGEGEPGRIVDRLRALEEENEELRGRLARGRETVDRILARIRFLEEQR